VEWVFFIYLINSYDDGDIMQKALIVCIKKEERFKDINNLVTIDELNEYFRQGWELESQDPFGTDFNLIVIEKKEKKDKKAP
jgi:hypothetical protein